MPTTLTATEISQMTRKQIVHLDAATIRGIYNDPDSSKLEAMNKILTSEEGSAALQTIVDEVSQDIPVEVPVVPDPAAGPTEADLQALAAEEQRKVDEANKLRQDQDAAEVASLAAAGITVQKDANGNVTKITKKYQALDENGQPIGHPTHLEARSWVELTNKQQAAHENAMRLAERIKKQKVTFKKEENVSVLSQEEVQKHLRVLQTSAKGSQEYNDSMSVISGNQAAENQIRQAALREQEVTLGWMRKHLKDFTPNAANAKLLDDWLKENSLEYTMDNLEVAFMALQSQLSEAPEAASAIPVESQPSQPVAVAPVVPATPVVAVAPVVAPQPSTAAPVTPTAGNQPVAARRPGANGGIQPGTLTASRPVTTATPALTKKDIAKMKPEEFRRRMKMEPGFAEMVNKVANS